MSNIVAPVPPSQMPFYVASAEGNPHAGFLLERTAQEMCDSMNSEARKLGLVPDPRYKVMIGSK